MVPLASRSCAVTWGYAQANRLQLSLMLPTTTASVLLIIREPPWPVRRTQSARRAMPAHTVRPPVGGAERGPGPRRQEAGERSDRNERRPNPSACWSRTFETGSTPPSHLRIRVIPVATCDRVLRAVEAEHRAPVARTTRSVLNDCASTPQLTAEDLYSHTGRSSCSPGVRGRIRQTGVTAGLDGESCALYLLGRSLLKLVRPQIDSWRTSFLHHS